MILLSGLDKVFGFFQITTANAVINHGIMFMESSSTGSQSQLLLALAVNDPVSAFPTKLVRDSTTAL